MLPVGGHKIDEVPFHGPKQPGTCAPRWCRKRILRAFPGIDVDRPDSYFEKLLLFATTIHLYTLGIHPSGFQLSHPIAEKNVKIRKNSIPFGAAVTALIGAAILGGASPAFAADSGQWVVSDEKHDNCTFQMIFAFSPDNGGTLAATAWPGGSGGCGAGVTRVQILCEDYASPVAQSLGGPSSATTYLTVGGAPVIPGTQKNCTMRARWSPNGQPGTWGTEWKAFYTLDNGVLPAAKPTSRVPKP